MKRGLALWLAVGWAGFVLLPWYAIDAGFWGFAWLRGYPTSAASAPALFQVFVHGKWWLAPIVIFLALFGALLVFAKGSALAPFIYSLF